MPISEDHRNLFQNSSPLDKLNLFQTLLDSGSLTSDEALALLNTVHAELGQSEVHDHSVYTQYAQVMESLRVKMPKIHEDISANWQKLRSRLQTKTDEMEAFEDDEPRRKSETLEKYSSKPPQKIDVNKGMDKRGGRQEDESEIEAMESGESEAEEMEGGEKEEDEVVEEKEEVEESEEKEETEEGEEPEESEEKEEEQESEEEKEEEKDIEEETEEKEEENKEEEETEEEEKEESKDEEVEEDEKEESEKESSEQENIKEEHDSREEADHMAMEAAEAAEHSEHAEIEMEVEPLENESSAQPPLDIEETDVNIDEEEEPPMEMPES